MGGERWWYCGGEVRRRLSRWRIRTNGWGIDNEVMRWGKERRRRRRSQRRRRRRRCGGRGRGAQQQRGDIWGGATNTKMTPQLPPGVRSNGGRRLI